MKKNTILNNYVEYLIANVFIVLQLNYFSVTQNKFLV